MKNAPSNRKTSQELKSLYGKDYVQKFENFQSAYRIDRLLGYINLKPNYDVVDFACGSGMLMSVLAPQVSTYVGVDFSAEFISKANEEKLILGIKNANFYCADVIDFCANHLEVFDCAFALDFSEHVYDDDWVQILNSIRKSLKRGGSLYLHTPNSLFFVEQMKKHSFFLKQFEEHIAVRSPEENIKLLRDAGYEIRRVLLIPHYNVLKIVHFLSYIPLIGKYFKARVFIEAVNR